MSKENTTSFVLNPAKPPKAKKSDLKRLDAMTDTDINYSDIPELTEDFWRNTEVLKPASKTVTTLRIDDDVLDWFRAKGKGYQSQMNAVLRAFVMAHKHDNHHRH